MVGYWVNMSIKLVLSFMSLKIVMVSWMLFKRNDKILILNELVVEIDLDSNS